MGVLMAVRNSQLTTIFLADSQLTTKGVANGKIRDSPRRRDPS